MGTRARQPKGNAYNEKSKNGDGQECARFARPWSDRCSSGRLRLSKMRRRLTVYAVHRRDKPISAARERFNVSWRFGGVAEHFSKPCNGIVKTMVEIDECVGGPNL